VVVRLIVADDPDQVDLARAELDAGIFVSHGILMEAEWVLRSIYKLPRDQIFAALSELLDHACVMALDPGAVRWSLERFRAGADFADMLHIIASPRGTEFASFEAKLAKQAGPDSPVPVIHLK
jgi:predicted nucleic-acid-binding protein